MFVVCLHAGSTVCTGWHSSWRTSTLSDNMEISIMLAITIALDHHDDRAIVAFLFQGSGVQGLSSRHGTRLVIGRRPTWKGVLCEKCMRSGYLAAATTLVSFGALIGKASPLSSWNMIARGSAGSLSASSLRQVSLRQILIALLIEWLS